jgi:hypothetical protein
MHIVLLSAALAVLRLQTPTIDAPGIVAAVLNRVMARPASMTEAQKHQDFVGRTLFLDLARTTASFRSIDPQVSPDYAKIGRPFVARSQAEAIVCARGTSCRVVDNAVYTAITLVEADTAVASYRIKFLLLWDGPSGTSHHGTETEMFVRLDKRDGWKVDRIGKVSVLN